jgi:hypothetical protein
MKTNEAVKVEAATPVQVNIPTNPPAVPGKQESLTAALQDPTRAIYANKTPDQIFEMFGGVGQHGVINKAIRAMSAVGFNTSQISSLLGKRYQHVRNVLKEPTKQPIATPNQASITLPPVSLLKKEEVRPTDKVDPKKDTPSMVVKK